MPFYRFCDITLSSNVSLSELPYSQSKDADCTFELLSAREPANGPLEWFHRWLLPDGSAWLALARLENDYLLRFPNLADFLVSGDKKAIHCYPATGIPLETVKHLFLDQVLPIILAGQSKLALHASAVATSAGAIAFAGETGQGKSTLAASFAVAGLPLMSDDCLLLQEVDCSLLALPSYPGLRLWNETIAALFTSNPTFSQVAHYSNKKRILPSENQLLYCSIAVPLRRVYFLEPQYAESEQMAISVVRLSPRDAFIQLLSFTFKLDFVDRDELKREFATLDRIAALPLFYRLAYPHDFSMLPAVRQAILADLDAESPTA
jgi:hypothetical protein